MTSRSYSSTTGKGARQLCPYIDLSSFFSFLILFNCWLFIKGVNTHTSQRIWKMTSHTSTGQLQLIAGPHLFRRNKKERNILSNRSNSCLTISKRYNTTFLITFFRICMNQNYFIIIANDLYLKVFLWFLLKAKGIFYLLLSIFQHHYKYFIALASVLRFSAATINEQWLKQ